MARFQAPTTVSQQILDTAGCEMCVTIQNTSAVTVYVSDDQGALDGSVVAGIPQVGLVLLNGSAPLNISSFKGKLFARAAGAGASIECISKNICSCGG